MQDNLKGTKYEFIKIVAENYSSQGKEFNIQV